MNWLSCLIAKRMEALAFGKAKLIRQRKYQFSMHDFKVFSYKMYVMHVRETLPGLGEVRKGKWERGDSIRYCHMVLLCAPMMSEALGLTEGTLRCLGIKVRMANGGMVGLQREK
ncbi:hypothetical protein PVK06_031265 [Gossypium arboreum]|uniref:Uncharacterized protein n=1 Tax=Gossypium arboreum TaxID=29729 RepID=A0ABR0NRI6_GOSAR|nr:hypothetical protein PVK06_031265 [Gossypium arboreum]